MNFLPQGLRGVGGGCPGGRRDVRACQVILIVHGLWFGVIKQTGELTVLMSGPASEAAAAEICADWTRAGAGQTVAYVLQCTALSLTAAHCTPHDSLLGNRPLFKSICLNLVKLELISVWSRYGQGCWTWRRFVCTPTQSRGSGG